jgi:cytoskeletal protein RodZ
MSNNGGDDHVQPHLFEDDQYQTDDYALSSSAARLLRPRRPSLLDLRSIVWIVVVSGVVALLVAIGIYRLPMVEQPKTPPQKEASQSPKQQETLRKEDVEAAEPFKSLVMDTVRSYGATGTLPVTTMPRAKVAPK